MRYDKAVEGFLLAFRADGNSQCTVDIYRYAHQRFSSRFGEKELEDITDQDLQGFWTWIRTDYKPKRANRKPGPLSGRSLENIWTAMRSFWRWAEEEFSLAKRPDLRIKRPRYTPREVQPFCEEEIRKLIAACGKAQPAHQAARKGFAMERTTALRDAAIFLTLLDTGLRAGELCRLRIEDLNLEQGELHIQPFGTGRKTKSRTVYLGNSSKKAIWRYLSHRETDSSDPLFSTDDDRDLDVNGLKCICERLEKRSGVPNVHAHRLRHTFAVEYLKNGGDVFSLQRLGGWSDLDMVKVYMQLAQTDVRLAHRKASPADRWRL